MVPAFLKCSAVGKVVIMCNPDEVRKIRHLFVDSLFIDSAYALIEILDLPRKYFESLICCSVGSNIFQAGRHST